MPFSPFSPVEDNHSTSYYESCGVTRDCMNMNIYNRNTLLHNKNHLTNCRPQITNDNRIHQEQFNRLNTVPYKNGKCLIDRETELSIQTGDTTMEKKSLNVLSEVSIDSSIPLVPEMVNNLYGHHNTYNFSNVGINSRNLDSNENYIKKCVENVKKINKEIKDTF
jgi:hypothetical protein